LIATAQGFLWGMTADDLTRRTGIAGGLCVFPQTTPEDTKLTLELAQRPSFIVHAQAADAGTVTRLRAAAENAGVLGRSLYVEQWLTSSLPYANRSVDLLVADSIRDSDLTPEFRSICLHALIPGRGMALIGRSKEAGTGLTKRALLAWVNELPQTTVIDDSSGVWVLLRIPRPVEMDEWSHRYHGAENARISTDATFKSPFLTQWWGMPRQEGFWGTTVVAANGRLFTLRGTRNSSDFSPLTLTARSLCNGIVLWQRSVHGESGKKHAGYVTGRSCLVAESDTLYLVDRDGVVCLDAETGAERDRIIGPKSGGQVKWMACAGGLLAILVGEADRLEPPSLLQYSENPVGRTLAVYDLATKKELWHDTVAGDIDERMLAVRDSSLYILVQGTGVFCRELRTGKTIWTNPDTTILSLFRTMSFKDNKRIQYSFEPQPVLSALDDVLLLQWKAATNTVVLSRTDGRLLWKGPADPGSIGCMNAMPINGYLLGKSGAFNLKDGSKLAAPPKFICTECGPGTATPDYLITCFGMMEDLKTGKIVYPTDGKSICEIGSIIAEGLMVNVPSECACALEIKGYRALATAPAGFEPQAVRSSAQERLTILDAREPEAVAITEADWPTYRHDAQRSAASTAIVANQPKVLWKWTPNGAVSYSNACAGSTGPRLSADFLSTAPVTVADRVWFGSPDGMVRCLNAADGKERWKFATGGMLFAPPTIWNGRAFIGSGDGCVYCLDAATGRELWRFQAAPIDRRVFWFGHYISTWPVITGVVVQDGVAYAVAGFQKENGIHAYALDAKSGQVRWEKHNAGADGSGYGDIGYSCDGTAAASSNRLWIPSMTCFPGAFDLRTGDWKHLIFPRYGAVASEIGVFDGGKWIFEGGRRLSETQDTLKKPIKASGVNANCSDAPFAQVEINDVRDPKGIPWGPYGTALPAWDADFIVMPPRTNATKSLAGITGSLTGMPVDGLRRWLTTCSKLSPRPDPAAPKPPNWDESKTWATEPLTPVAFVLAKNQVVASYEKDNKHAVSGFNRADGAKAWTIDLPEQPAMNRLALDRVGRVLVSLCDGSVICIGL